MTATVEAPQKYVGQPLRRKEDIRLLTGQGRFSDDFKLDGHRLALPSPVVYETGGDKIKPETQLHILGFAKADSIDEFTDLKDAIESRPGETVTLTVDFRLTDTALPFTVFEPTSTSFPAPGSFTFQAVEPGVASP